MKPQQWDLELQEEGVATSMSMSMSMLTAQENPPCLRRRRHYVLLALAFAYVAIDYLRVSSPGLHGTLQPLLWGSLAVLAASRAPFYPHWSAELRAVPAFLLCLLFMLAAFVCEAVAVQYVTAILGLHWHSITAPLPDAGQWGLLDLNEKLPPMIVEFLRAHLIVLHHYLMLFLMLAFSVLFGMVKAPGLGLAARYMFTMGVGRLLRVLTFASTILPSARPWCAKARFRVPDHPHPWVQKYYMPYAYDHDKIRWLLHKDMSYVPPDDYPPEYTPNWGYMQFLVNFLRPLEPSATNASGESWFETLRRAGGGCNDLVFSGHILVSVLTAMAWTEAYPGWGGGTLLWLFVLHTAQREIRERHHYSVDVVAGIYMGILLWRTGSFLWTSKDKVQKLKMRCFAKVESRLMQAAKDGNVDEILKMLRQIESVGKEKKVSKLILMIFAGVIISLSLGIALLAFVWTADG